MVVIPPLISNECPGYNSQQSYGEDLFLELWVLLSTTLLQLLPASFWSKIVAPVRIPSVVQKEQFNFSIILENI